MPGKGRRTADKLVLKIDKQGDVPTVISEERKKLEYVSKEAESLHKSYRFNLRKVLKLDRLAK
jgi:hypothetical protein